MPIGYIWFNTVHVDNSNNFDIDTFKAPVDGIFIFFLNCYVSAREDALIEVRVNFEVQERLESKLQGTSYRQLSGFWSLDLKAGDEVSLFNYYEISIYADDTQVNYFMGYMNN